MLLKFTLAKTDTWRHVAALVAIGDAMYRSGKRAGEMRKDNSNNAGEQPRSVDDNQRWCRSQDREEAKEGTNRRRGREVEAS